MTTDDRRLLSRHRAGSPGTHRAAEGLRGRRGGRTGVLGALAVACVWGITGTMTLPAFATDVPAATPQHQHVPSDREEQSLDVSNDVDAPVAVLDPLGLQGRPVLSWTRPVVGTLGDPFGPRPDLPVPGVNAFHRGQDIVAPCGSTIRAAADGVVENASYWGTYGNWVLISHGKGLETGYAHASTMLVAVGEHVQAGQPIATVGTTGASTGCHLHFETHINGVAVNPVPFMAARKVKLGG